MTSDEDIVAALEGRRSVSREAADAAIHKAFRGGPTAAQRGHTNAVLEALGDTPVRTAAEGELPLQKRGDDLEAVTVWATTEAAQNATASLAQALMRVDGNKGIYAAEAEAREIAAEAYAVAAETLVYEDARQEHVKIHVSRMAEFITQAKIREAGTLGSTPPAKKPTAVTESTPPGLTRRVTTSKKTGHQIVSYS